MSVDDLESLIVSTQQRRAADVVAAGDPVPAIQERVGRMRRRRRRTLVATTGLVAAASVLCGLVLSDQLRGGGGSADGPAATRSPQPVEPTPLTRNDVLRDALAGRPEVQAELIGSPAHGTFLCGLDVLGSSGGGRTLYLWLTCGDFTVANGRADLRSAGSEAAVVAVTGVGTAVAVRQVTFPRQAHLDADITRLFPSGIADRVRVGDIPVTPSLDELKSEAATLDVYEP